MNDFTAQVGTAFLLVGLAGTLLAVFGWLLSRDADQEEALPGFEDNTQPTIEKGGRREYRVRYPDEECHDQG